MRATQTLNLLNLLGRVLALVAALALSDAVEARQCGPCESVTCQTQCIVTCQSELQAALNCLANSGNCTHIVIPSGCTVDISGPLGITSAHSGTIAAPNRLSIIGAIEFTGTPDPDEKIFNINGLHHFMFDGGGTITSEFDPEIHNGIAKVFRFFGNTSSDITIRDLTASNLTSLVEVENGVSVSDLTVINVHGSIFRKYGFYVSDRSNGHFENCSIDYTIDEHPFRLYSYGGNLVVKNCWSYRSGKTGLWTLDGEDVEVDGFTSDQRLQFGPDHGGGSPFGARLLGVFAQNLQSLDHIRIQTGVIGGCFVSMCGDLIVGRAVHEHTIEPNRPLDYVNWAHLSGVYTIIENPNIGPNVSAIEYDYCFADVDRSEAVDVVDLLAVINSWGPCPAAPPGLAPPPPCASDIYPNVCGDHVVNVQDLLHVINNWGGCPATPVCGVAPARQGGTPEQAPQDVEDCWDKCAEAFPEGSNDWAQCYDDCVHALQEAGMIE